MRKMLANFSNIGVDLEIGETGAGAPGVKRTIGAGGIPTPIYGTTLGGCGLAADEDGLAAGLLDGYFSGGGELVGVDGDGGGDLAVVEDLDEAVLLAEKAERDDLFEGELGA